MLFWSQGSLDECALDALLLRPSQKRENTKLQLRSGIQELTIFLVDNLADFISK